VISHGRTTAELPLNQGCVSAQRKTYGEETCIILMNISPDSSVADLSAYRDWNLSVSLTVDGERPKEKGTDLHLPPWSVVILTPNT
jgi:hypothetical protein